MTQTILKMLEDSDSCDDELNARICAETHSYLKGRYTFKELRGGHLAVYVNANGLEELLYISDILNYTTSLDAAMSIGKKELSGWSWYASEHVGIKSFIMHRNMHNERLGEVHSTMPRAICYARIAALEYVRKEIKK